ncbi:MAG TPA: DUF4266 domain-containing protein [Polyangiaceae bacterium]|nr:DUF4266 domain-containing protein [Polyangiaceae bacterium]
MRTRHAARSVLFRSRFFWAALIVMACAACAEVPSYARGRLAHPTMSTGFAESAARDHREAVQEGATGGSLGPASGCGCN